MIYLDNAATSGKKPSCVIAAVENALRNYSVNPGRSSHSKALAAADRIYGTRTMLCELFGASGPQSVAFTANCTLALNCIIKGALNFGDHVIISDVEHNAVLRPLHKLSKEGIIEYSIAKTDFFDADKTVQSFSAAIKENTKMIICSHASNVCGNINPIEKIGKLCSQKGLLFAVDAAQTAGVLDINMQKSGIDFLAVAPHKGLLAPMGTGVLIADKPISKTIIEGGTGTASLDFNQPEDMPEALESGTVNLSGIMGLKAGAEYVKRIGIERIYTHELRLAQMLYCKLEKMPRIILYTPMPQKGKFVSTLSFNLKGVKSDRLAAFLSSYSVAVRAGYHCSPLGIKKLGNPEGGTLRVSIGLQNGEQDIAFLIKLLKKAQKNL